MSHMDKLVGISFVAGLALSPTYSTAQISESLGAHALVPIRLSNAFEIVGATAAERMTSRVGPRTALALATALQFRRASAGFWLGTALEGSPDVDTLPVFPLMQGGFWRDFRAVRVSIQAESHAARLGGKIVSLHTVTSRDSLLTDSGYVFLTHDRVFGDSSSTSQVRFWTDFAARISWRVSSAAFEAVLGGQPSVGGAKRALSGHLTGSYEIAPHIAVVGSFGAHAPYIGLGVPSSRFASLALRVTPWRSAVDIAPTARSNAFIVTSAGPGRVRFTCRAPGASSVDVSGDFARWRPVPLVETHTGVWETTLALSAGTYRVNMRINGDGWTAPPGLPQARDDFNGTVGILVVP